MFHPNQFLKLFMFYICQIYFYLSINFTYILLSFMIYSLELLHIRMTMHIFKRNPNILNIVLKKQSIRLSTVIVNSESH